MGAKTSQESQDGTQGRKMQKSKSLINRAFLSSQELDDEEPSQPINKSRSFVDRKSREDIRVASSSGAVPTSSPVNGRPGLDIRPSSTSRAVSFKVPSSPISIKALPRTASFEKLSLSGGRTASTGSRGNSTGGRGDQYDDITSLFMDDDDDGLDGEFEFSMDGSAPRKSGGTPEHSPMPPKSKKSIGWSFRKSKTGSEPTAATPDSAAEEEEEEEEEVGELGALAPPPSAPPKTRHLKRESSATLFVKSLMFKVTVKELTIPFTPAMNQIRDMLLDMHKRKTLINEVLPIKGDYGTRLRFVASVDQCEQMPDLAAQLKMGKKIVQLFVSDTGKFCVKLSPETVKRVQDDLEFLKIARQEVLEELSGDEAMMNALKSAEEKCKAAD
jgi:hypothetical protein